MSYRKLHPDAVWPLVGAIAGALLAAVLYDGEKRWLVYLLTAVGCVAGFIVNAVTKKS
jgi:hypothetical protein